MFVDSFYFCYLSTTAFPHLLLSLFRELLVVRNLDNPGNPWKKTALSCSSLVKSRKGEGTEIFIIVAVRIVKLRTSIVIRTRGLVCRPKLTDESP